METAFSSTRSIHFFTRQVCANGFDKKSFEGVDARDPGTRKDRLFEGLLAFTTHLNIRERKTPEFERVFHPPVAETDHRPFFIDLRKPSPVIILVLGRVV